MSKLSANLAVKSFITTLLERHCTFSVIMYMYL